MERQRKPVWTGGSPEPCVLLHDASRDCGDPDSGNMLIHGDNLTALRALEGEFAGQVQCVYIDPPYNTGAVFAYYEDRLEHTGWMDMMGEQLDILRRLLSGGGAAAVQIDVNELFRLKLMMDEIFGPRNFVSMITVKTKIAGVSGSSTGKSLQDNTEYILLYAKDISQFSIRTLPQKKQELMDYIETYTRQGKSWKYTSVMTGMDRGVYLKSFPAGNGDMIRLYRHENVRTQSIRKVADREFQGDLRRAYYANIDRIFRTTNAQTTIRARVLEETRGLGPGIFRIEYVPNKGKHAGEMTRFYYKDGNLIAWLRDVVESEGESIYKLDNCGNLWDDIPYNNLTKEGGVRFPNGKKPELLAARVIGMLSGPGDLVLDSFLGSGTTAAVAHKMGRRYIGIEAGDHCYTHCKPRLDRVVGGEQSGVSRAAGWQGGGGYRFYELAPARQQR